MTIWSILAAIGVAMFISAFGTVLTSRLAVRAGMLDMPGRHKAHARPVPLLGGCAIFLAIAMPLVLAAALARTWASTGTAPSWLGALAKHVPRAAAMAPSAMIVLAGALLLHALGLLDDRLSLSPLVKLFAETGITVGLVLLVPRLRVLTVAGEPWSSIITAAWVVTLTNAFNFLDNMDGLSAGVGAIAAAALLGVAAQTGQVFVSGWLALVLGATLGFLPHNFAPARVYMGDAGSLVLGYLLGVLSCLTTYVAPGSRAWLPAALTPLVVMAIPIYDMISVVTLRIHERRSPMVGDRNHFSHRLVRRGMNVRTAVLTIYLCAAATGLGALLLLRVTDDVGAMLVFAQTLGVLLIVALLELGRSKQIQT
jgi:UDP-GlcNAc:undecaprenyl-phosphate/decaprenyl-phosphate GlcNAc-1-phosphate transferase